MSEGEDNYRYYNEADGNTMSRFLSRLSPGMGVELQYDDRPPASGTFQGFEDRNVILTDYDNFPGLVRIAPNKINAVAPFSNGDGYRHETEKDCYSCRNYSEETRESVPKLYI